MNKGKSENVGKRVSRKRKRVRVWKSERKRKEEQGRTELTNFRNCVNRYKKNKGKKWKINIKIHERGK